MIILGIDPGTARMGWGILNVKNKSYIPAPVKIDGLPKKPAPKKKKGEILVVKAFENGAVKILDYGTVVTEKEDGVGKRLGILRKELAKLIVTRKPDVMAVERLFFGMNAKTAIAVGQATGIIMLTAAEHNIPVIEYTGLQVKLVVAGTGRADKKVLQTSVRRVLGIDNLSFKGKKKGWDDAADALAIAICHILKT